jgi:hypothetical protein
MIEVERLVSSAIKHANGAITHGAKTHTEVREKAGYEHVNFSKYNDIEGFWTSRERFVNRNEAKKIGIASGQVAAWRAGDNSLLQSSAIRW